MNPMRRWLSRRLHIESGEVWVTVLMFFNIFSILTFYFILKPLRAGLFLAKIPAGNLPYAYFLTAIFAGTLAALVFRLSRRLSAITLLTASYSLIIITLLGFHWAVGRQLPALPYVYFVYVEIIAVLTTAQFWLLAGLVYDNRQSKRLFPLLGTGAVMGATAGSAIPGFLSARFSAQSMILICAGLCAAIIVLSRIAWHRRRAAADKPAPAFRLREPHESTADLFRTLFSSRHLFLIAVLVFLSVIAGQVAEWQAFSAAQAEYQALPVEVQQRAINQLFGRFYFVVNVLGIGLQLLLTGYIVRRSGIGLAVLILPLAMCVTSTGVLAYPSLITTLLVFGSNSAFRHSVNRVGIELLYLPLTAGMRKKTKLFIDVFVDRLGRGIAGIIILALTSRYLPIGLRGTGAVVMVLTALGILVSLRLRKSYVDSFRLRLARREVDMSAIDQYVTDPASIRLLIGCLESPLERQVLYGLRLLQGVRGVDFSRQLLPLLRHSSEHIRREAVLTLSALPGQNAEQAEIMLGDGSAAVRMAAVDYLCTANSEDSAARMRCLMQSDDLELQLFVARRLAQQPHPAILPSADRVRALLEMETPASERAAEVAAWLAARLPAGESVATLRKLLHDPRASVVMAAARAAGFAEHAALAFDILPLLSAHKHRGAAREALVQIGPRIIGLLGDVLADPRADLALRREIPWVLGRCQTARAAEILVANLGNADPILKYQALKALNRIHDRDPKLPEHGRAIAARIFAESRAYYEALTWREWLEPDAPQGRNLLSRALQERLDQNLEIIFRLLGLQYPQRDIYFVYSALKDSGAERRASAIEFLDNLLHQNLKSVILPLVEESSAEHLIDRASQLFGIRPSSQAEILRAILRQSDVWLKACALHEIGCRRIQAMAGECRQLANDPSPLVRETAQWALRKCA